MKEKKEEGEAERKTTTVETGTCDILSFESCPQLCGYSNDGAVLHRMRREHGNRGPMYPHEANI